MREPPKGKRNTFISIGELGALVPRYALCPECLDGLVDYHDRPAREAYVEAHTLKFDIEPDLSIF